MNQQSPHAQIFQRACQVAQGGNYDFGIELMSGAIKMAPNMLLYRQTIRGMEEKKYGDNGTGARMSGMKLAGTKGKIKKARMTSKWNEVDRLAEEGLKVNPWDASLNYELGDAAEQQGFLDIASFGFMKAVQAEPENIDYLRRRGLVLMELRDYDEAAKMWERIMKIDPRNTEARQNLSNSATAKHTDSMSFSKEQAEKEKEAAANAYDASFAAQSRKQNAVGPGDDEEADLQRAIRKEPEEATPYMRYADWLRNRKRWSDAVEQYRHAYEKSGEDPNLKEKLDDTHLTGLKETFDKVRIRYQKAKNDEDLKQKYMTAKQKYYQHKLKVLKNKEERYQNDMRVKFELAELYFDVKEYDKSIPLLQQAQNDSRIEGAANLLLGKCFAKKNNLKLALRSLKSATEHLNPQDALDEFCEAHYVAGQICEHQEQWDDAEDHYNEVIARNFNFRDVNKRLETVQTRS